MGSVSSDRGSFRLHVRRLRVMEQHILTEPNAFNTSIAVSPSFSSDSSSDLDTESTGSFFYDKSITLGNLIGLQSDLGVITRVGDGQEHRLSEAPRRHKRKSRSRSWWGLCGNCSADLHESNNMPPSLGQFLEVERKAAASNRREKMYFNIMYDEYYSAGQTSFDSNGLFAEDRILPPHSEDQFSTVSADQGDHHHPTWVPSEWLSVSTNSRRSSDRIPNHHRSLSLGSKVPTFFSGICGRASIET